MSIKISETARRMAVFCRAKAQNAITGALIGKQMPLDFELQIQTGINEACKPLVETMEYVEKLMLGPSSNSRSMQVAGPARSVLNAVRKAIESHRKEHGQ